MSTDFWRILGIEPTQDLDLIRQAYRTKLPQHHPETDPEGFKALRLAYEQAQRYVDNPQAENEEQQLAATKPKDPDQILYEQVIEQYQNLINDAERCYQPDEWHQFISQLDEHSIDIVEKVRWPLLDISYNTAYLSRTCLAILAERLRWQQRLMELDKDYARDIDDYLAYIAKGDLFDMTSLSNISRAAQQATMSHVLSTNSLFWNRPFNELYYQLNQHTVVYYPNNTELMDLLLRWHTLSNQGCEVLLDHCLTRLAQHPDNAEYLYLAARQYTLLDQSEQAFDYWLKVYHTGSYRQQTITWLLFWCSQYDPDRLPLLVQAMNESVCMPADNTDFEDPKQQFIIPQNSATTIANFANAAKAELSPLVASFVQFGLSERKNYRWVTKLLLQDDGSQPLLHLYRHAVMLHLGNETLLEQIMAEPEPEHPLDKIILQGLQHQAQQHLVWLTQSPVVAEFVSWLNSDDRYQALPEIFTREDRSLKFILVEWLRRLRYIEPSALIKLQEVAEISVVELGMFDWISNLFYRGRVSFNPPENNDNPEAYWQWYRQNIALLGMVNDIESHYDYLHQDQTLTVPEQSPIHELMAIIRNLSVKEGDSLSETLFDAIPRVNYFYSNITDSLDISLPAYLANFRDVKFNRLEAQYSTSWQTAISQANPLYQLLLNAILIHQDCWQGSTDFADKFLNVELTQPEQTKVRQALMMSAGYPYSEQDPCAVPESYRQMMAFLARLQQDSDELLLPKETDTLWQLRDEQQADAVLRLCAGLLLAWQDNRQDRLAEQKTKKSRFWQVFQLDSRISRTGMLAQLLLNLIPVMMLSILSGQALYIWLAYMGFNTVSAVKRRLNDIGYPPAKTVKLTLLCVIFPVAILWLLFARGISGANRYGPDPKGSI